MKVVVNKSFGSFYIGEKYYDMLSESYFTTPFPQCRADSSLIDVVNAFGAKAVGDKFGDLTIVDVPDDATDWEIYEYDGREHIVCVVNGKIKHIYPE